MGRRAQGWVTALYLVLSLPVTQLKQDAYFPKPRFLFLHFRDALNYLNDLPFLFKALLEMLVPPGS